MISILFNDFKFCVTADFEYENTALCDNICQWLAAGKWFSPVSSIIRTDLRDGGGNRIIFFQCVSCVKDEMNVLNTTLCNDVCQWLATGRWCSREYSCFLHQYNWPPRYNWNIVESGVKHHKPPNIRDE